MVYESQRKKREGNTGKGKRNRRKDKGGMKTRVNLRPGRRTCHFLAARDRREVPGVSRKKPKQEGKGERERRGTP